MNEHMVFAKGGDGLIRSGGFIINDSVPIVTINGLALPAGLYTMHGNTHKPIVSLEPSTNVAEPSICDYLFQQMQIRKRETRKNKSPKRKTPKKKTPKKK